MATYIGCDVGTVSVKAAVVSDDAWAQNGSCHDDALRHLNLISPHLNGCAVFLSEYRRIGGSPLDAALGLLSEIRSAMPQADIRGLRITGSGAKLVADYLGVLAENEFRSVARGVGMLYPDVSYIFEMGGENSKFLNIQVDTGNGDVGIVDYETNGDCAAGTGSFMDQQASRLLYDVEAIGDVVLCCSKSAKIAGRCSVFAKSDMIHAQQKGATPPEILKGLCEAVARNFKGNIARGREVKGQTAFVGGVAHNRGVVQALMDVFGMTDGKFFVPEEPAFYSAIGAALIEKSMPKAARGTGFLAKLEGISRPEAVFPSWEPLSLESVRLLRNEAKPYELPEGKIIDAYLGVDVGSVSTNLVCIDIGGNVIHEIYLRTEARPVEVVGKGLEEIEEMLGRRVAIRGVGTTGSGRELIGELIGADTVNDEITAHKTGAFEIAKRYLGCVVDTIFEIGGQDSKFISLRDGIVVDFTMNEACAAGTGSFLEEQAEKLNINIVGEFAELAFEARKPLRLGERCTVYMEQDVTSYQQRGADKRDVVAGLAYSVVQNYLNRVVRGRHIGDVIFFQGGTAYNDSVAAAFSTILGKQIIVPPHNGVVGAYGAALLAKEKTLALEKKTTFRGYHLDKIDFQVREFTCKACSNFCDIQEFTVEGKKTYWGDKCSDRYRREAKTPKKPVIPDLLELRDAALMEDYLERFFEGVYGKEAQKLAGDALGAASKRSISLTIGIPSAMYFYDRFPFWGSYLRALGFEVITSEPTTKHLAHMGIEEAVAEPCYPIQVAHGHVGALLKSGVDFLLLPNVIDAESEDKAVQSYMCPWGQALPFIIAASPLAEKERDKILSPLVHFREGSEFVEKELWQIFRPFAASRKHHRASVLLAYRAQAVFLRTVEKAGQEALSMLHEAGEIGIIIVGRPYNIYDKGVNMNIPSKLRRYYGVNVIPLDFLPLSEVGISDVNPNMFWNFGKKILQAARITSQDPNLHIIYITNFKCGPDSYVKQFAADAAVKPFLTLQFDGHGNDAGMMTRCEAYLDSKGVLRWWQQETASREEPYISPEWAMGAREPLLQHSVR